ncbi:hypothetical protein [Dyadobacter crusticola]|uniref:hypothetical protein n=1 Tax=Dyadobacter crusticola TaxID=292407 RepID=UPI0004E0E0C5|nr:hypothetical protein [Dyadobacter crusticola]
MGIGTIKAVHIYIHEQLYLTAELELNVKGVNYSFGGKAVLLSGREGGEPSGTPLLGRFLFRCMQICEVDSWDLLKSRKVLVEISNEIAVAIGNPVTGRWFRPAGEFQQMLAQKNTTSPDFN